MNEGTGRDQRFDACLPVIIIRFLWTAVHIQRTLTVYEKTS